MTIQPYRKLLSAIWYALIVTMRGLVKDVKQELIMSDGEDLENLVMNHDTYIVDLYRQAAKIEGLSLRDFLLKYGLAFEKPDGVSNG